MHPGRFWCLHMWSFTFCPALSLLSRGFLQFTALSRQMFLIFMEFSKDHDSIAAAGLVTRSSSSAVTLLVTDPGQTPRVQNGSELGAAHPARRLLCPGLCPRTAMALLHGGAAPGCVCVLWALSLSCLCIPGQGRHTELHLSWQRAAQPNPAGAGEEPKADCSCGVAQAGMCLPGHLEGPCDLPGGSSKTPQRDLSWLMCTQRQGSISFSSPKTQHTRGLCAHKDSTAFSSNTGTL